MGLVACGDEDHTEKDPTYSYTDSTTTTTSDITNLTFSDGLTLESSFPYIATAWTVSADNSAVSSSVKSGIVNVSEEGWTKTIDSLKEDRELLDYVKVKYGSKTEDDDTTRARLNKDGVFVSPGTRPNATDNYVYMLNNYREMKYTSVDTGVGTAQKVVSSKTVSLEKGNYYKLGVWVNTYNLRSQNPNGFGANVRLINTINGNTLGDCVIENINENVWKDYTIYVKADDTYNCTLNVVLGLGYGNGANALTEDYVEGTVYFDDITFEKIGDEQAYTTAVNGKDVKDSTIDYTSKKRVVLNKTISTDRVYLYDMVIENELETFFTGTDFVSKSLNLDEYFTKALNGTITSKDICAEHNIDSKIKEDISSDNKELKLTLTKASATVNLPINVVLNSEEYVIVNFKIKNELSNFGSTDIVIDVWDIMGSEKVKQPAVATFSTPSEDFVDCTLLIKNNFDNANNRQFEIDVVIGPSKVAEVERANDFASGEVVIKNVRYQKDEIDSEDNEEIRELVTTNPNATVSLYAGYGADFDDSADTTKYSFTSAPGNIGEIVNYPTNPSGYDGIVSNHAYISNKEGVETSINTRSGENGTAGLINSSYIESTANYGITLDDLGNPEEEIQPLMINNKTSDSYGFVANKATTLAASAIASFSVKVRVLGGAKAFVYLVDASITNKNVLTFEDFTVNTDVVPSVNVGDEIDGSAKLFAIEITSDMCDEDGWANVSFFIANGKYERQVRLELWNGNRTATEKSTGIAFFNDVEIKTSSAFTKSEKWNETFSVSGNPLYDQTFASYDNGELLAFRRNLTEDEVNFNAEYPDQAVEYFTTYVWAKNSLSVYADYSTLDDTKVITNPYDSIKEEETASGCAAATDPSTFWLSFSTIILIVALVLAFIALIAKNVIRKRKANASDAKSHYKVTSRIKKKPEVKEDVKVEENVDTKEETEEVETAETTETTKTVETEEVSNDTEDTTESTKTTETTVEETDGYVYGDVIEDFTVEETESTDSTDNENK
jgi:hypothetical protein